MRISLGVAALVVCASALHAQVSSARLEGTVVDQSGAAVVSASVSAINTRTQATTTVKTNDQGFFIFPSLVPSTYRVTVEATGFRKAQIENLELNVSAVVNETIRLEVGSVSESITVEATSVKVQTSDAQVGRQVTLKDIDTLPQLARGPLALVAFVPGASVNPGDTTFTRINGNRQGSNNVKLDGIDVNDAVVPRLGLSLTAINTDSVEEFKIITNGGKAEYGRNAGGQVEMITRSGSNRFSGNLFDYHRNTVLNANTFFANSSGNARPKLIQNIFGGSVGGPIIRDKTFFFYNYQGRRTAQDTERNRTVLSDQARQGIFQWRVPGTNELRSYNIVTSDPRGFDPRSKALIDLLPRSNNGDIGDGLNTAGFRFNNPSGSRENQMTAKFDHNLWSAHRVFFRYSRQTNSFIDALNGADAVFPGRPQGTQGGTRWGYSIGSDWLIKPNLINEFRFGYQSADVSFLRPDRQSGPQVIPNSYTNPINAAFAQGRNSPVYDFTENMTWVKGKSTWKYGFTMRRTLQYGWNNAGAFPNISLSRANGNVPPTSVGPSGAIISSADRQRFEDLYNDVLGLVSSVAVTYYSNLEQFQPAGTGRIRNLRFADYGAFVQNDWKLASNLTLNLGLRWEAFGSPAEDNGFQGALDKIGQVNAISQIRDFRVQRASSWFDTDWQNWAPRFGFAWDPFKDGKTSIRGGYGIFYDRMVGAVSSLVDGNTPGFTQPLSTLAGLDFPVGTRASANPPIPQQPTTVPLQNPVNRNASVVVFRPDLPTGYVHQFNFSVQREVLRNMVIDIGWVRTQGHSLFTWQDLNQPRTDGDFLNAYREIAAFQANPNAVVSPSNTLVRIFGSPANVIARLGATTFSQGLLGTAADTLDRSFYPQMQSAGVSDFYLRNFPQYNQFIYGDALGRLWYDSLQLGFRRTAGSLRVSANYTFSKSIDNGSVDGNGFTAPIDNRNLNLNRARGDFDRPHSLNWTTTYILPFGQGQRFGSNAPGWANQIIGGWELGVLGLWQSGTVMTLTSGRRTSASTAATWINYSGDRNIGSVDRRGNGVYFFTPEQVATFTATSSFPAAGEIGTSGRNAFRGPRFFNVDVSLVKRFPLWWERHSVSFRAEAYNVFNNVNFGQPGTSIVTPATFGRIQGIVGNQRLMQLALRYDF